MRKPARTVYPRWRGEHFKISVSDYVKYGLSPLARGTQGRARISAARLRFIPAGAGNTDKASCWSIPTTVYPRWRGEHTIVEVGNYFIAGLSPLARGTPLTADCALVRARFIPAGAGNTDYSVLFNALLSVYPRWRGEHCHQFPAPLGYLGLSPLARGTCEIMLIPLYSDRFIPAGAGNIQTSHHCPIPESVYPRWRGEHRTSNPLPADPGGLSPLARGTLNYTVWYGKPVRFIPAGAGNMSTPGELYYFRPVYPRWRGEHIT